MKNNPHQHIQWLKIMGFKEVYDFITGKPKTYALLMLSVKEEIEIYKIYDE
jgi:hypothetical protein